MKAKEGIELREAAERIFNGEDDFACDSIRYQGSAGYKARLLFSTLFRQKNSLNWFGYINSENQDRRIIALLLAAEIADSGGL